MKNKLKLIHLALIIFILGDIHFVLLKTKAYGKSHYVDIPLHIIMGLFLGLVYFWRQGKAIPTPGGVGTPTASVGEIISYKSLIKGLILFGFLGGLAWEILEVIIWRFLPLIGNYMEIKRTAITDTFKDLSFDVLGSLAWLISIRPKTIPKLK